MDSSIYEAEDKSQRRRVIIIATAVALIVLGIASWAIIAIVSGGQEKVANTQQVAVDDASTAKITTEKESSVSETTAPLTEGVSTTTPASTQTTTVVTTTQESVPNTGPEELLPIALIAGLGVAYLSSRKFVKSELTA